LDGLYRISINRHSGLVLPTSFSNFAAECRLFEIMSLSIKLSFENQRRWDLEKSEHFLKPALKNRRLVNQRTLRHKQRLQIVKAFCDKQ
ncbi:MAG: hypothetical protein M1497_05375, partial [Nitrospirae bacterium]|nr:hypothetical protein [Nitrospirota bacterium]